MKVVITDSEFPDVEYEKAFLSKAGIEAEVANCKSSQDVISACADADGLLVQWAPVCRDVISAMKKCKVIVRYGVGYENVDAIAAAEYGIAVCNVPDYATGEVADHAVSLALALTRQLPLLDQRLRAGIWNIVPDYPMPSFRDMRFVTFGFGRIAQSVIERVRPFGFELAAYDPFIGDGIMKAAQVVSLSKEEAFRTADILSLHLPLNANTNSIVNRTSLAAMKRTAVLINTSRGGLVDTKALADALSANAIFAVGLDVFEREPLENSHPILRAPRTLLTSHISWHSTASAARLQRMAAEEVVRGVRKEPLRNQVNADVVCLE